MQWPTRALGEIAELNDGDWIETKDQGGHDYRLLQISNIGIGSFRETGNFRFVTQDTFERLRCREVLPGMVLIARMPDPTGRAWHVTELPWRAITAVDVAIVEPDRAVLDPRYLSSYLNSPQNLALIAKQSTGTTRARITRRELAALRVPVPALDTQRNIAGFIGGIDDLIQANERRIEILEDVAQLLYREWFVRFRFPGHEHTGFVESELGQIPEGWAAEVTGALGLSGVLQIGDGYRAKNSEFAPAGVPFLRISDIHAGELRTSGSDLLPDPYVSRVGSKASQPGDCVVAMKGTVGRAAFVHERTPQVIYSPQVSFWRALDRERLSPFYLRAFIASPYFADQCARVKGATDMADYVNLKDQRKMVMLVPSRSVMAAFIEVVGPEYLMADVLRDENRSLAAIRNCLLPPLVTGAVDVSALDLDDLIELTA